MTALESNQFLVAPLFRQGTPDSQDGSPAADWPTYHPSKETATSEQYPPALNSDRYADIGRAPTFSDTAVEVEAISID